MKSCKGLLTAFGLSCTPHISRQTRTDVLLRPHPVDTLLQLAIAPIAAFHRLGRRGEQRLLEHRQRVFPRGGKALLQRGTAGGEPLHTPPQRGPFVEGRLGPTAPIDYRISLLPERPQRLSLGEPTADAPQGLPCGFVQVPRDAQRAGGEQRGVWRGPPRCRAGRRRGRLGARTAPGPCGVLSRHALARAGHRLHHGFDDRLDDVTRAPLMGPPAKDRGEGGRREGRTIGGHAPQRQVTPCQGRLPPPPQGPEGLVGGLLGSDVIEQARGTALRDRSASTAGPGIAFIGSAIPRKIRPGPGKERGVQARRCRFFPPPRPSFGAWPRARPRGGRATGAHSPGGRATRLRPRGGPPERSPGG
jgi:hypothetical protein